MSESVSCEHVFVYRGSHGGYAVTCKNCGAVHGFAESKDMKFLEGFNRNTRILAAEAKPKSASRRKRRSTKRL